MGATRCLINMTLHDMPVQPAIHQHRAFHVDLIAHFKQSQIRAFQRLLHRCHGIGAVFYTHYGQAHAIVSHTLVYSQLVDKRTLQCEIDVISIFLDSYNGSKLFYNSGKHISTF